jgi:hypothetical protein
MRTQRNDLLCEFSLNEISCCIVMMQVKKRGKVSREPFLYGGVEREYYFILME